MQVFTYLTVDIFVVAPTNDDFLNGDELTHGIETADNLLRRILPLLIVKTVYRAEIWNA